MLGSITTHRTMPRWRHHLYFPFHQKELRSNLERKGKYLRQFVCQFELVQKNYYIIHALPFYLGVQIRLVFCTKVSFFDQYSSARTATDVDGTLHTDF